MEWEREPARWWGRGAGGGKTEEGEEPAAARAAGGRGAGVGGTGVRDRRCGGGTAASAVRLRLVLWVHGRRWPRPQSRPAGTAHCAFWSGPPSSQAPAPRLYSGLQVSLQLAGSVMRAAQSATLRRTSL